MTINDSQSLAGHSSSISTLTKNSILKIQLTKCMRDLLTQKDRRHSAFAVEKEDIVDMVSKAWDESPPLPPSLQSKKLLLKEVGVH
jgi:hypothetical protein